MALADGSYLMDHTVMDQWVQSLMEEREVIAPVEVGGQTKWQKLHSPSQVAWKYSVTMTPASKVIYKPRQDMVQFEHNGNGYSTQTMPPRPVPSVLLAVHPCDLHGIMVIERTLLGRCKDPWYQADRQATLIVGLNCQSVCPTCFCSSYGTGPFYHRWMGQGPPDGCDVLLTDLGEAFLVEAISDRGRDILPPDLPEPTNEHVEKCERLEHQAIGRFSKFLDTRRLPEMLLANLEHPVWERVAERRCLSCTNCTMVCPTCYCYKLLDRATLDLKHIVRTRHWDSCQDLHFAEVHFGNFRLSRKSRLRQFICHKLSYWVPQHGCFGCIGCGRCIHWCPTKIDLTEVAAEIRQTEGSTWTR